VGKRGVNDRLERRAVGSRKVESPVSRNRVRGIKLPIVRVAHVRVVDVRVVDVRVVDVSAADAIAVGVSVADARVGHAKVRSEVFERSAKWLLRENL
jgi:hypothetical protein